MPNPENLIGKGNRFKKGQSGNPKGRPKEIPELKELLADVLTDEKNGISAAKTILMALRAKAVKGDVRAAEILLERAYGKASQKIDVTTQGEKIGGHIDLTKYTDEELRTIAELQRKGGTGEA